MAGRFRTVHGGPGRLGVLREAIDRDNAVARMHGQVRGVPKAVPGSGVAAVRTERTTETSL